MKRNSTLKAVLALMASTTSVCAVAQDVVLNGVKYRIAAEDPYNYAYVMSIEDRTMESVDIASEVEYEGETWPVKLIGQSAFNYCTALKQVTIPSSIQWIDGYSFMNTGLESLTIPESVEFIGNSAFAGCQKLEQVDIKGVRQIDNMAFSRCNKLVSITLPANCDSISPIAFQSSTSLKEILFAEGNQTYSSHDGIVYTKDGSGLLIYPAGAGLEFDIPEGTDSIGERAFYQGSIQYVTFPQSLRKIGQEAFYSCNGMDEVTIDGGVEEIGDGAFRFCGQLELLTIGDQVRTIGPRAFDMCMKLKEVTIPDGVTSLGEWAFDYNTALQRVTLGNGITVIPSSAFSGCSALTDVTFGDAVNYLDYSAFSQCRSLKQMVLPESVDSLADAVFYGCWGMEEIRLGSNVKKMGGTCFLMCTGLKRIYVAAQDVPEIAQNTFYSDNYTNATLYVPQGTKNQYKSHAVWGLFDNIEEDATTGVQPAVAVAGDSSPATIYRLDGTLAGSSLEALPVGIYVVRTDKGSRKVSK